MRMRKGLLGLLAVGALCVAISPAPAQAKKKTFKASFTLHTELAVKVSGGSTSPQIQSSNGTAHTTLDASWQTRALVYRVPGFGKVIDFGKKLKPEDGPKEYATAVPTAPSPGSRVAAFTSSGSWSGRVGSPPFTEPFSCSYDIGSGPAYAKVLSVHYVGSTDHPSENEALLALGDVFGQAFYGYDLTSEQCSHEELTRGFEKPNGSSSGSTRTQRSRGGAAEGAQAAGQPRSDRRRARLTAVLQRQPRPGADLPDQVDGHDRDGAAAEAEAPLAGPPVALEDAAGQPVAVPASVARGSGPSRPA